jgi:5-methylcytosine-specific restriction endonuclease McrA
MGKLIGEKPLTAAERVQRWREKNPDRAKEVQQQFKERNPDAASEASKKHYSKNTEKLKAKSNAWRASNREESRRHRRESYYRHRDKNLELMHRWQSENMGKVLDYQHARRAKKEANGIYKILDKELQRILNGSCNYCGSKESIEIDHVIPISRGGSHGIGNLQPLCKKCNRSKSSRLMIEFRTRKVA